MTTTTTMTAKKGDDIGARRRARKGWPSWRRLATVLAGAALLAGPAGAVAEAHHSYGATYDVNREITLEGTILRFVFRNPHSFVHVQVPDESGVEQRWSVEWSATTQLANQGVTRETLKVGDKISIVGRPSRVPGEYRALMVRLTRASDGFTWGTRAGEAVE